MRGFPSELLVLLLFGAALIFNFVMQRAARRKEAETAPQAPDSDEIPESVWRGEPAAAAIPVSPVVPVMPFLPAAQPMATPATAPAGPATTRRRRRFSRQSLLRTRRQVQNAVAVAAILGPCRGDEPLDPR